MKVADVMTRRVVSISPDATILDAVKLMLKHHISGLPVIDRDARLVGIVTEGDFLRRPETGTVRPRSRWLDVFFGPAEGAQGFVRSHGTKVAEVMIPNVITVAAGEPLERVVHLMEIHQIKRLPVLHGRKVVGIVSRANLMRALTSVHRDAGTRHGDTEIRDRILDTIERQGWSAGADVDVVVRSGVVDIWGTLADPEQRSALRVLVEGTPGVRSAVDHLRWTDDATPS